MIKVFLSQFKKLDWSVILIVFFISLFSLLSLWSTSQREGFSNFYKQIFFFVLGFFLMFLISFFDWRFLKNDPYLILTFYFIFLFLLGGLFLFAPSVRGIKAWYKIGPFSFEPIDFMYIIVIIILAKYFSLRHIELYRLRHIFISGVYVFLPSLLAFFQPDLGAIIILLGIWIFVLLISGIKLRHFFLLILIFLIIFSLSWHFFLKDYQRERIISFLNPGMKAQTSAWSQTQSKIAIGSGGLFGKGIRKGTQTQYGFLPEPQTDFIFAAISEETGFLGSTILLLLFFLLFWRLIKIASLAKSNFSRLFIHTFSFLISFQAFINIGMNLGILPVIGIPLPFVSYGGSNLMALFLGLGIVQSMKIY